MRLVVYIDNVKVVDEYVDVSASTFVRALRAGQPPKPL